MGAMHEDEVQIGVEQVARLIETQFPGWAGLPLRPMQPEGTDNAIFRLGESMSVRLPRIAWAAGDPTKEHTWLPRLEPSLTLAVPTPLGLGRPAEGYAWDWSVCAWLPGESAVPERLDDPAVTLRDLTRFLRELWAIDTADGPPPGGRGGPLRERDEDCLASIAMLDGAFDRSWLEAEWDAALDAAPWSEPPIWLHGDLDPRNLLATEGRLSGVLDWGALAVGDPAADLMVAWKMLDVDGRTRFRAALDVDEPTWRRARGWALSQAVMILSYYTLETNAVLVLEARRWLSELRTDAD